MERSSDGIGGWLRKSATGRLLGAHLGAFYIRLVAWTTRWDRIGRQNYDRLLQGDTGVIAAAWHGRLFMAPLWVPRNRRTIARLLHRHPAPARLGESPSRLSNKQGC